MQLKKFLYPIRSLILILILFLNCTQYTKYLPRPEEEVKDWIDNFARQKSFDYVYELKTRLVHIKGEGECIIGFGEHIRGIWESPESSYTFEYIGINDLEWAKIGRKWEESARGEESDIFAQIKRMFEFDKFEYLGSEKDFYSYQFKANVPFLEPQRWREMTGFLQISKKNFLPTIIWAGLPDSSVYWYVKISNINKEKKIIPPSIKILNYEITWDTLSITVNEAFKKLKQRLDLTSFEYQLEKKKNLIILKVPAYYQIADLQEILKPGNFICYGLTDNKSEAKRTVYLKDNPKKPLYVSLELFNSEDIKGCEVKFDHLHKPYITVKLKKHIDFPTKIAYELDGLVLGITTLDFSQKLNKISIYPEMTYRQINLLKGILIQPLFTLDIKLAFKGSE
ncbi:MAG: hypothetical protein ABIL14_03850 [candidate division WOR-3 bacterium]